MEDQIHPGDRRGDVDQFLPVELERSRVGALALDFRQGRDKHPARTRGRVVDALAGLGLEHLDHQVDKRPVGIELLRCVAGVVGELLDKVLVAVAELVLRDVGDAQGVPAEVLDEIL